MGADPSVNEPADHVSGDLCRLTPSAPYMPPEAAQTTPE